MKRIYKRPNHRRFIIREQLATYGRAIAQDIPYQEKYLNFMLSERNCESLTAEKNLRILDEFVSFLKQEYEITNFKPEEIEPFHIRRYLVHLKKDRGNKPSTRNSKLCALSSYYLFLECYEYLDEEVNPTLLIRRARVSRQLPIYLTKEESERLLLAASISSSPERDVAILRVMMQTGLRVGELIKLRTGDIDFNERTLLIRGKGHRERMVPLTDKTCSALIIYLAVRKLVLENVDALFLNYDSKPLQQRTLYMLFKELCRQAEVQKPKLSVCHLRHTCLTLLLQEGADLMALKKLAGHKSVRTTQVYLHVTQNQLRTAMKKHPLA